MNGAGHTNIAIIAARAVIIVAILLGPLLGGCALLAVGVIGATVEYEHGQYCAHNTFDPNCRDYWWGKR